METLAHQQLKRLAVIFLREHGCRALAMEVRCPISRFRVDVAGWLDRLPAPGLLPAEGLGRTRAPADPRTVVIECKQCREDFLRDREKLQPLLRHRQQLNQIRCAIEEQRIKVLEPQLQRSGSALFPELESWDFSASRLPAYRRVLRKLQRIDARLHGQTKFFTIARYRLADYLYIAAPRGMLRPRELPHGWGLLECAPNALESEGIGLFDAQPRLRLAVEAQPNNSKLAFRQRLLRNIAVAASMALIDKAGRYG